MVFRHSAHGYHRRTRKRVDPVQGRACAGWLLRHLLQGRQNPPSVHPQSAPRGNPLQWLDQDSGYLFLNRYGERITTRGVASRLAFYARKYGINPAVVHPHAFRHRYAKNFLEKHGDLALLADLLGHENIATTRIYLRKSSLEQRKLIDQIVDWLPKKNIAGPSRVGDADN